MDHREDVPSQRIRREHVTEQLRNVSQLVVLVSVNRVVVLRESLLEEVAPETVDLGEALANEAKELRVSLFLRATLDNHRRQLGLLPGGEIDLHELVHCFFGVGTGHDRKVDGSSKVYEISIRLILDLHRFRFGFFLFVGAVVVAIVIVLLVVTTLSQDLCLQLLVSLFMLLPLRIELEDIEAVLDIDLTHQVNSVCDLILLLNKVQLILDSRVVLEFVLPDLEEYFDHVLCPLADVRLVENIPELVEDNHGYRRLHFLKVLSNLLAETNSDLHAIIGRLV